MIRFEVRRVLRIGFLALIALLALAAPTGGKAPDAVSPAPAAQARCSLAITLDDLPLARERGGLDALRAATTSILAALGKHGVTAVGFVNEGRLHLEGEIDERVALLERWVEAGHDLGNHTYSHLNLKTTPPAAYQDDIIKGGVITGRLMEAAGRRAVWFRHPMTNTGPTKEVKEAVEGFLRARGLRVAPFTIETSDYIFNVLWMDAAKRGDRAAMERLRAAYLEHHETMLAFFERASRETFGREIPQVLLIHANDINAALLDEVLSRTAQRGYRFVELQTATEDPAYGSPDGYIGPAGPSWIHRWRAALGLPAMMREEPDPPRWVLDAFEKAIAPP